MGVWGWQGMQGIRIWQLCSGLLLLNDRLLSRQLRRGRSIGIFLGSSLLEEEFLISAILTLLRGLLFRESRGRRFCRDVSTEWRSSNIRPRMISARI
jgi:hypothetical protein